MKQFRPMRAGECPEIDKLSFPVYCSPKYDGIRCVIRDGKALSRSLKPIPNAQIRCVLEDNGRLEGLDGELIIPGASFQEITSFVMDEDKRRDDWCFVVFDQCIGDRGQEVCFEDRHREFAMDVTKLHSDCIFPAPQFLCYSADTVRACEKDCLDRGYEGLMIRSLDGFYKYGRSTTKGGELLKLKRFQDSEAEIIGFVELMHNANEATKNELGQTKRSSKKAGKVPAGKLGALQVRDIHTGVEFEIGTGFTDEQRVQMWSHRDGASTFDIVKYKFQAHGVKNKPRCPVFLGFRSELDL